MDNGGNGTGTGAVIDEFDVAELSVEGVQVKLVRGRNIEVKIKFPYDDGLFSRFGRIAGLEKGVTVVRARFSLAKRPSITDDEEQLPLMDEDGAPTESVGAGEEL